MWGVSISWLNHVTSRPLRRPLPLQFQFLFHEKNVTAHLERLLLLPSNISDNYVCSTEAAAFSFISSAQTR